MASVKLVSGRRPVRMDRDDGFDGITEVFRQQAGQANVMHQILHRHTNMIQENTAAIGDLARATHDRFNLQEEKNNLQEEKMSLQEARIAKLERSVQKQKARLRMALDSLQPVTPSQNVDGRRNVRAATLQPEVLPLPRPGVPRSTRSASSAPKGRGVSTARLASLKPFGQDGRRLLCPMCDNDYSRGYILQHMDTVCHN